MFHFFVMLGTSLVLIEALMMIFWLLYLLKRNISIVDIGWGLGFIVAAFSYFILGEGFVWRKLLVLTIVSIWALRLVWHLVQRFKPNRDDPRYELVMQHWPLADYPYLQVLTMFLFQGLLVTILSLPFALMNQNVVPFFSSFEMFGLLIWMGGVVGETVADWQLSQFKKLNPEHANPVFQDGLWKYSRHPNYFFEWIIWIGYAVMSFSAPFGWLGILSPLLMLFLLLRVSGIPLTEKIALSTKGEAYRDYQMRTSPFFPWFSRAQSFSTNEGIDHHEFQNESQNENKND